MLFIYSSDPVMLKCLCKLHFWGVRSILAFPWFRKRKEAFGFIAQTFIYFRKHLANMVKLYLLAASCSFH
jgi:hypothetical protein